MEAYLGQIILFAGKFAPVDWAFCDGTLLQISEYDALFSLLGTTYGGDGQTNFALPDLRGRVPIHRSSTHPVGQIGGTENVGLTTNMLPSHSHAVMGSNIAGTTNVPTDNLLANSSAQTYTVNPSTNIVGMNQNAISSTGNGLPHPNMMPFLALNYIICVQGIYPPQN